MGTKTDLGLNQKFASIMIIMTQRLQLRLLFGKIGVMLWIGVQTKKKRVISLKNVINLGNEISTY